jgi:octaprenyl-diphosphate synthase
LAVAAGVKEREKRPATLDALTQLLRSDLDRVNVLILERMQSPVALIPQLAGHIIAAGGKRLRPMLTLASARLCGYRPGSAERPRHVALAAAVEFIHTATLLHDDVVDSSDLRRGLATANAVWGNKASVLVGDFLFSRAFQLMVEDGSLRVLDILSHASAVIAEGEVLQLVTSNDTTTTEAAYLEVISAKTAQLFAAAAQIGAVVCGRPAREEEALERFGRNLGTAFQLVDDVLDYSALTARSRCRSCSHSTAATRRSARSGGVRLRKVSSATAISGPRSSSSTVTVRCATAWRVRPSTPRRRAPSSRCSPTGSKGAPSTR